MSEYTSYAAVHVDNLKIICGELTNNNITSVLLADHDHPLYKSNNPEVEWDSLPYKNKWLILMTADENSNDLGFLPLSINLTIDENRDRWSLDLYKKGEKVEFLFSDTPWGDMCAPDPKDDLERIKRAKNISDADLTLMEELFQIERENFLGYLKMGDGMVWDFLKIVGLPASEMECYWDFYYPKEGNGRCILWNEYFKIVD